MVFRSRTSLAKSECRVLNPLMHRIGGAQIRMKTQRVKVIDGPVPAEILESNYLEAHPVTTPEDEEVMRELMQREPLFHRPEFGMTRAAFEKMTAPEYWEVGASGRRYYRKWVMEVLEKRYENATEAVWEIGDFYCMKIAADNYLATYTLIQGERVTRRATIWRRTAAGWQIVYHQGTVVWPTHQVASAESKVL